jgi:hypothetical protein
MAILVSGVGAKIEMVVLALAMNGIGLPHILRLNTIVRSVCR